MKKNHNHYLLTLFALAGVCLMTGCKHNNREKIDITSIHTTAAETLSEASSAVSDTDASTEQPTSESTASNESETKSGMSNNKKNISTTTNTYTSGNISIQYPSVINLDQPEKAAAIDALIKENALAIIQAYELDDTKDTLNVTCTVLSADRSRITITYQGLLTASDAAHPVRIFYANTINVNTAANISFRHYADPYTMAGYVMSNDCLFVDQDPTQTLQTRTLLHTEGTLEYYTELLNNADFPIPESFPSSFSYEHEGTIFFSLPVGHAAGDYVIVSYTPDGK